MGKHTTTGKGADFFLTKFWTQVLGDPGCRHVVTWDASGKYLIIYDTDQLMAEIKARNVCKQKDYDSFARQLRIYRWGRVRQTDEGHSPWPEEAKVWRHPKLTRDSDVSEVSNITRNAPPKPNRNQIQAMADNPDSTQSHGDRKEANVSAIPHRSNKSTEEPEERFQPYKMPSQLQMDLAILDDDIEGQAAELGIIAKFAVSEDYEESDDDSNGSEKEAAPKEEANPKYIAVNNGHVDGKGQKDSPQKSNKTAREPEPPGTSGFRFLDALAGVTEGQDASMTRGVNTALDFSAISSLSTLPALPIMGKPLPPIRIPMTSGSDANQLDSHLHSGVKTPLFPGATNFEQLPWLMPGDSRPLNSPVPSARAMTPVASVKKQAGDQSMMIDPSLSNQNSPRMVSVS